MLFAIFVGGYMYFSRLFIFSFLTFFCITSVLAIQEKKVGSILYMVYMYYVEDSNGEQCIYFNIDSHVSAELREDDPGYKSYKKKIDAIDEMSGEDNEELSRGVKSKEQKSKNSFGILSKSQGADDILRKSPTDMYP